MEDQHIYHHNDSEPKINVKVEKNSRGLNYEATVMNTRTVKEAMKLLKEVVEALEKEYGTSPD